MLKVTIRNQSDESIENVALSQIVPSGFEIMNCAILILEVMLKTKPITLTFAMTERNSISELKQEKPNVYYAIKRFIFRKILFPWRTM